MTPRKAPDRTRTPVRSTAKREAPHRPRTAYPPEQKAAAVAMMRGSGIAATHRATGVPKGTLSGWARAAGIDLGEAARARTAAATAHVEAAVAEVKLTTVNRLERILEAELDTHADRLELERALSRQLARVLAGDLVDADDHPFRLMRGESAATVMLRDPDGDLAQLVGALELLNATSPKRDTVGAWTRAVHDLALLRGEATERGDVLVTFGIPRPDTSVRPIPQEELSR